MARIMEDNGAKAADQSSDTSTFQAHGADRIDLPNADFVSDAQMSREGDNLVLQTPDGHTAVIEGYFSADPAPVLHAPDGSVLTPNLVHSFLQSPMEYAANDTASDESPVGAVEEVKGNATVTRADGTVETITNGTPIYEGDVIQTDAEGAVNIVFLDETSMAVSSNARLAIDDYSYDPTTESGTTNFSVLRGLFVFTSGLIGRDDPDDVKIETPVGSIGIRGTIIAGEIMPGGESNISVLEGAIVIKNGVGEITLSQQFETVKLGGFEQPMQAAVVLPASEISTRFSSIGNVNASLFSTINDAAHDQPSPAQTAPAQDAPQSDAAPEQAPSSKSTASAPDALAPIDSSVPSLNASAGTGLPSSEVVAGQTSSGLGSTGTSSAAISTGVVTTAPVAATGTAGHASNTLSSTVDTAQPPPSVLGSGTTTNSNGNSNGNTTTTPRPLWADINLNTVNAASHQLISDSVNNKFGFSISALGDINNDGLSDFIVGNDTGTAGQNHSYIFTGSIAGITATTAANAQIRSNGTASNNTSHTIVAGVGDVNGDGDEDYVVAQYLNGTGTYGIVRLHTGVLPNTDAFTDTYQTIGGGSSQYGYSVSGVGDFDNDGYDDYVIGSPATYSGGGNPTLILGNGSTPLTIRPLSDGSGTDAYGSSVTGLGDFNGDGYSDMAVGAPGGNYVNIVYGHPSSGTPITSTHLTGSGAAAADFFGTEVAGLGDINGDGYSDLLVGGENSGTIFFGGGAASPTSFTVAAGYEITGGAGVGDFNGDGYADFSVSLTNASGTEIYVVLGNSNIQGQNIDYAYLQNANNAIRMNYSSVTTSTADNDIEIAALGDVNGDGYDDMGIGVPDANGAATGNGGMFVVYGRDTGNVQHGSAASANNVSVVGDAGSNNGLSDGGFTGVNLRGGAGADTLTIQNTNFLGMHGGTGFDTLGVVGNLDFSNVNFERMSGIDQIRFDGAAGQTITLTMENLFNLLKSSDDGILKIEAGGVGNRLNLFFDVATDINNPTNQVLADNIESEAGLPGGYVVDGTTAGYNTFQIGGYKLLIDTAVTVDVT